MRPEQIFKEFTYFKEKDPFNLHNELEGYVSHDSNYKYGALLITHINNTPTEQIIYCTPKIPYPFDKNGNWHFPTAEKIESYRKIDGTNIFMYRYFHNNIRYITFKTRLNPFIKNSKFGPFLDMWNEILQKYGKENFHDLNRKNNMNISFELFGSRNKHLIEYDISLDIALLFAVDYQGKIYPPSQIDLLTFSGFSFPTAGLNRTITKQYVENYKMAQLNMNDALKETEDGYKGEEGEVWYIKTLDGKWSMVKCKPEIIEKIHFAAGGPDKNTILATCYNVFENFDELNFENVKLLLSEEFPEKTINDKKDLILSCIDQINSEMEFKDKIVNQYKKLNLNIFENKVEVMRHFSTLYPKTLMRKIYNILQST